jgi:hypothetical protein
MRDHDRNRPNKWSLATDLFKRMENKKAFNDKVDVVAEGLINNLLASVPM